MPVQHHIVLLVNLSPFYVTHHLGISGTIICCNAYLPNQPVIIFIFVKQLLQHELSCRSSVKSMEYGLCKPVSQSCLFYKFTHLSPLQSTNIIIGHNANAIVTQCLAANQHGCFIQFFSGGIYLALKPPASAFVNLVVGNVCNLPCMSFVDNSGIFCSISVDICIGIDITAILFLPLVYF